MQLSSLVTIGRWLPFYPMPRRCLYKLSRLPFRWSVTDGSRTESRVGDHCSKSTVRAACLRHVLRILKGTKHWKPACSFEGSLGSRFDFLSRGRMMASLWSSGMIPEEIEAFTNLARIGAKTSARSLMSQVGILFNSHVLAGTVLNVLKASSTVIFWNPSKLNSLRVITVGGAGWCQEEHPVTKTPCFNIPRDR